MGSRPPGDGKKGAAPRHPKAAGAKFKAKTETEARPTLWDDPRRLQTRRLAGYGAAGRFELRAGGGGERGRR